MSRGPCNLLAPHRAVTRLAFAHGTVARVKFVARKIANILDSEGRSER